MKKLTEQQIKEGNRLIAEFMEYKYYHKGVDIDYSDIGGLYERFEIFSKTPILVQEYPEDDQYYFASIPNPDFGKQKPKRWNPSIEFLDWGNLNEYKTELAYHNDFNALNEVSEKIKEMKHPIMLYQSHIQNTVEISSMADNYYIVRESSTILKPIEVLWLAIVNFIKIYNKKNAQ